VTFAALVPNTTYFMQVKAVNYNNVQTAATPLPSGLTFANTPGSAAPTNVQATQITANWTSGGNPFGTTYIAQISADPGFSSFTTSTTVNSFATFTGLSANTQYFMKVQTFGYNNVSTAFTILPSTVTLPNAPGALPFTGVATTQLQANWTSG